MCQCQAVECLSRLQGHKITSLCLFYMAGWLQRQLICYAFKTRPSGPAFDGVLEQLCRHGMYLLKSDDDVVTAAQLQENPINIVGPATLVQQLKF